MKHVHLLAGLSLAVVLIACGGSDNLLNNNGTAGNTTSGSVGITPLNPAVIHIEAVVLNPTTYDDGAMTGGQTFIVQDLNNIESEDQIEFQLAYEDSQGRHVINPGNWLSSDTANTYGTLTYNSGIFIASSAQNLHPLTITTEYNGFTYSSFYSVLPRQVRLRGMVVANDTHTPVFGAEVDFYGPQNPTISGSPLVFRGKVTSAYDGTFRASIPPSTSSFTVTNASISALVPAFQRYMEYLNQYYQTDDSTCYAPLQTYQNGERFMIDFTNPNPVTNGTVTLVSGAQPTPTTTACSISTSVKPKSRVR